MIDDWERSDVVLISKRDTARNYEFKSYIVKRNNESLKTNIWLITLKHKVKRNYNLLLRNNCARVLLCSYVDTEFW